MRVISNSTDGDGTLDRATAPHPDVAEPGRQRATSDVRALKEAAPVSQREPELQAGDVLEGRYTLISPLGEGGMGDVWLAYNATLDIQVALKVLRVDANQPGLRAKLTQRLLQEARATAKLGHPAIVRIIDFGETPSGNGFYVMELLDGEDLHSLLERHGRLSTVKAVRTLLPIAGALVVAHGKNIVHRDLKPENIFLTRDKEQGTVQPKLIDFGVAKLKVANERITQAGAVLGSPGYMAPEQARGEDVDERADVWGFTVVLYETISGRLPFEGKNYNALLRSIIEDAPAPITGFGVGDEVLAEIIARGLAKDPDKRWQTMRELGSALARWLLQRGVTEDICGAQLATTWMRDRSEVALESGSPAADPFVSGSIAGDSVDAARRERAEMATAAPPPPLESPVRVSTSTAAPPKRFVRSRPLALAAIIIGVGGGIAIGTWALRRSSEVAPARDAAGSVSSQPAAPPTQAGTVANVAPPVAATAAASEAQPSAVASEAAATQHRPQLKPGSFAPKPRPTAAPAPTSAAKSSAPTSALKNPY